MGTTLEQYFRDAFERNGEVDHSLKVDIDGGEVRFTIQPTNCDGDTVDFSVSDNAVDSI